MNANCASYPKVSLGLGFKNPTREDSYLKSATPIHESTYKTRRLDKFLAMYFGEIDLKRCQIRI
jgi:hypothetical protein